MPAKQTRDIPPPTLNILTGSALEQSNPTFNIVSPTPRAFTFPATHNLSYESPCPSPSQSPFEPELRSYGSLGCSTSIISFPPRESLSPSPTSPSSSRRQDSSDADNRPKKGEEGYIKRPENAFILFRRQRTSESTARSSTGKKQRQADMSKTISQQWKSLLPDDRKHWENLAKQRKREHEEKYPNYVYRPQRAVKARSQSHSKANARANEPRQKSSEPEPLLSTSISETAATTAEPVTFSIPLYPQRSGRSSSVPAGAAEGYHSFSVPNVYSNSCSQLPCSSPDEMSSERRASWDVGSEPSNYYGFPETDQRRSSWNGSDFYEMPAGDYMPNMFGSEPETPLSLDIPSYDSYGQPSMFMSPASSSGPLTPASEWQHFTHSRRASCSSDVSINDPDMQLGLNMQQQEPHIDFSQYTNWDSSAWDSAPSSSLLGLDTSDFDLSSVQPAEVGASWGAAPSSSKHANNLSFDWVDQPTPFDDFLSAHQQDFTSSSSS